MLYFGNRICIFNNLHQPADALDNVDCWEPSSKDVPSGPVVITEVTVPLEVEVTFIADVPTQKTYIGGKLMQLAFLFI